MTHRSVILNILLSLSGLTLARAQDNYEIQVYPSETVTPATTMVEVHSNFTVDGTTATVDGVLPTHHALHETLEITQGLSHIFELGFYIFTSDVPGTGLQIVGSHIRPRLRAPTEWQWPVGVSLSTEFGYARPAYSSDQWTLELRPIVDKQFGELYVSLNPTADLAFDGADRDEGAVFSPNVKVSYEISDLIEGGFEYYGALGPFSGFVPSREQQQQIFPTVDLNFSPEWEFNFGVGIGLTPATDHLIAKLILGRRFRTSGN